VSVGVAVKQFVSGSFQEISGERDGCGRAYGSALFALFNANRLAAAPATR